MWSGMGGIIEASSVIRYPWSECRTNHGLRITDNRQRPYYSPMIEALKEKLQAEVERLNYEINFVLPKEIEKARAHGDLRENSEYKAALKRQGFAQARVH